MEQAQVRHTYIVSYVIHADSAEVYPRPSGIGSTIMASVLQGQGLPSVICPTSNCTWPITPTLGLCTSCVDARDRILKTEINEYQINYTLPWLASSEFGYKGNTNLSLNSEDRRLYPLFIQDTNILDPDINSNGSLLVARTHYLGVPIPQYKYFTQKYCSASTVKLNHTDISPLLVAHDCSLSICLQGFSAQTITGDLNQEQHSTWGLWNYDETDYMWSPANIPAVMNVRNESTFRVASEAQLAIKSILSGIMNETVNAHTKGTYLIPDFSGFISSTSDPITYAFWDASNSTAALHAFIEKFASTFTTLMRTTTSAAPPDHFYAPTVLSNEVFVRVRWGWLAFPLGLLVEGYAFLFLTIRKTRRRRIMPWKNSRGPLLLAKIDDSIRDQARGGLVSRTGLEKRVGQVHVLVEYDDEDQICFVTSES